MQRLVNEAKFPYTDSDHMEVTEGWRESTHYTSKHCTVYLPSKPLISFTLQPNGQRRVLI